jgi:glycosyltransferase involved in cell wall biosynthesis
MMKVSHVTIGHEVTDTRILRRECAMLRDSGFRVTLMAQNDQSDCIQGIHIDSLPVLGVRWFRRFPLMALILARILRGKDQLLHFHDPDLLPIMLIASLVTRKPVVWDVHEDYQSVIAYNNKLWSSRLSRLCGRMYAELELKICSLVKPVVVTVSEPIANRYRKAGIKAVICANYVDHREVPFPVQVKPCEPPKIIMSGTIQRAFAPLRLVEAFAAVSRKVPCKLGFYGTFFPPSLNEEIMTRASELGVAGSVECGGPYPWKELVCNLIAGASIGVLLCDPEMVSHRSTTPNRLFEYWANGVPAICSKDTVSGDLVEEQQGGLTVPYHSTEAISEALERLLSDEALARKLGMNGRRSVDEKYNWSEEGAKLVRLYKDLIPSTG